MKKTLMLGMVWCTGLVSVTGFAQPSSQLELKTFQYHNQTVYTARFDPKLYELKILPADGLETVSSLAKRHQALAAINGSFFRQNGQPASVLKINTWRLKPFKRNRGVMGWSDHEFFFDRLEKDNYGSIVSEFHQRNPWWNRSQFIVGGTPLLIYKSKVLNPEDEGVAKTFIDEKHARTAVCLDKSHHIVFALVAGTDALGKTLGLKMGLSLPELTDFLIEQQCVYALNLDGGSSSTMVVKGKVLNAHTLPLGEREVANILAVKSKS